MYSQSAYVEVMHAHAAEYRDTRAIIYVGKYDMQYGGHRRRDIIPRKWTCKHVWSFSFCAKKRGQRRYVFDRSRCHVANVLRCSVLRQLSQNMKV